MKALLSLRSGEAGAHRGKAAATASHPPGALLPRHQGLRCCSVTEGWALASGAQRGLACPLSRSRLCFEPNNCLFCGFRHIRKTQQEMQMLCFVHPLVPLCCTLNKTFVEKKKSHTPLLGRLKSSPVLHFGLSPSCKDRQNGNRGRRTSANASQKHLAAPGKLWVPAVSPVTLEASHGMRLGHSLGTLRGCQPLSPHHLHQFSETSRC